MNNDSKTAGFARSLGDIVSEVLAPVRLRRKALAVAGAFVLASGAAACSAGPSPQTAPPPAESPAPSPVAATASTPSPTPSAKAGSTPAQKVNANYKKFDPKNFGDPMGDGNRWSTLR